MISNFRKSIRSWATVLLLFLALVAIVVTGFGTGGFGGIGNLRGGNSEPTGDQLATVGGQPITASSVSQAFNQAFNQARRQTPTLEMTEFLQQGAYEGTLRQMIVFSALDQFGQAHGLVVTKRMVDRYIAGLPIFRNLAGQFDNANFRQTLQALGVTEAQVREDAARALMQRQLLAPLVLGTRVPQAVARAYAAAKLEQRRGSIGIVTAALMEQGLNPGDAEIAQFYQRNRAAFTVPERRVIKYAVIGAEQAPAAAPTEAEINAVYRNTPQYAPRETRNLQAIVLPTQAAAQAFAQRVRAGTPFLAAATQAGFQAEDISFANQSRQQFQGATTSEVAAAAFGGAQGSIAGPFHSELGYHVVRVERINTTPGRPLESVRADIAREIERRKHAGALSAMITRLEDQIEQGASFEEVARGAGLTIVTTPAITATGQQASGQAWPLPPDLRPLIAGAFDIDADHPEPVVEPIQENARYALITVDRAEPAAAPPLAIIRDRVRAALVHRQALARARDVANAIAARINAGTPPARAFAEAQPRPQAPQSITMRRMDIMRTDRQAPPPLVTLFRMRTGHAEVLAAPNNAGWFVVAAEERTPGDAATNAPLVADTQRELTGSAADDLAQQFARAIEARADVRRNDEAIAGERRRLAGSLAPAD